MKRTLFLDTSAIYSFTDKNDERGPLIENFLREHHVVLITTNFILAESLSLITKRQGKQMGIRIGELLHKSSFVNLYYLDKPAQEEAWIYYKKYKDKDFDFIDSTSFIFCKEQGINEALTLDRHFSQMGFKTFP